MKKILIILALIVMLAFLFIGCDVTTPGGSGGAEGEGEEEGTRVVMVELFVAPTCSHCPTAKEYMARLLDEYGFDKLVVLEEYAWNYGQYTGWATPETISRFYDYVDNSDSDGGTPDAYFNGLNEHVGHNYCSYYKYKLAIMDELEKPAKVSISASYNVNGSTVSIEGNIKNISSETLSNIVVSAMIYEDSVALGSYTANHVVRDIVTPEESGQIIESLSTGVTHEFSLVTGPLNYVKYMSNIHVVVFVQAPGTSTKEILQALYLE